MSYPLRLAPFISGCVGVLLVGLSSGCVHESQANAGPRLPASAAMLEQVTRPPRFPSRWDAANWQARESAFTNAGLVEVKLQPMASAEAPREDPEDWCQQLTVLGKQVVFSRGGTFGVAPDGTLHCVKLDMPSRGEKSPRIEGRPPNCVGGAYQEHKSYSRYFVIPAGLKLGGMKTLSAPQYDVTHRYTEDCPQVPTSRPSPE